MAFCLVVEVALAFVSGRPAHWNGEQVSIYTLLVIILWAVRDGQEQRR